MTLRAKYLSKKIIIILAIIVCLIAAMASFLYYEFYTRKGVKLVTFSALDLNFIGLIIKQADSDVKEISSSMKDDCLIVDFTISNSAVKNLKINYAGKFKIDEKKLTLLPQKYTIGKIDILKLKEADKQTEFSLVEANIRATLKNIKQLTGMEIIGMEIKNSKLVIKIRRDSKSKK